MVNYHRNYFFSFFYRNLLLFYSFYRFSFIRNFSFTKFSRHEKVFWVQLSFTLFCCFVFLSGSLENSSKWITMISKFMILILGVEKLWEWNLTSKALMKSEFSEDLVPEALKMKALKALILKALQMKGFLLKALKLKVVQLNCIKICYICKLWKLWNWKLQMKKF